MMTKNMRKRVLAFVMACASLLMMFSGSSLTAHTHAAEVAPCYNNVFSVQSVATISAAGKLTITNSYRSSDTTFSKSVITTYVEKKILGLFWTRVDIGMPNNQWVDTLYDPIYTGGHSFQLTSGGTYRITVKYIIFGTGGAADEVEKIITKEY